MAKDIIILKQLSENSVNSKYKVVFTSKFNKAWRKYSLSGKYKPDKLYNALRILSRGENLPYIYKDHELKGNMIGFRECHIESNLLLIYKICDDELRLVEIGSHSELFG